LVVGANPLRLRTKGVMCEIVRGVCTKESASPVSCTDHACKSLMTSANPLILLVRKNT
jgi:hypothetical protein